MKSQIRTVILFFLTAVFAVSAFMLVRQMTSYRAGDEAYAEASEIAAIPEVTETETVQQPTEQPQQETADRTRTRLRLPTVCTGAGADGPACPAAGQQ